MQKIKFIITGLLMMFQISAFGQSLTLKQCIEYAKINNSNIKMANYESIVSDKKISEQKGTYLPTLDLTSTYTDNVKLSSSLMPGELFGQPGTFVAIQTGVKYGLSNTIKLTQNIFSPSYFSSLTTAKVNKQLSEQNKKKTTEETVYNVSKTYYKTLIIGKQLSTLQTTLDASEKSLSSTELKYKTGVTKKIELDKIKVSYNSTKSQLQQTELSYKQSLNTLKYAMGMPLDNEITLTDTLYNAEENISSLTNSNYLDKRTDYQIEKTHLLLKESERRKSVSAFLPTLSFYAKYTYDAMGQKLLSQDWYPGASVGLTLSVPIFDGFQRNSKLSQSEVNIKKAEENIKYTEQSIKVEISNYEIQYRNALDNIKNEKENLELAESVYKNTQLDYQHGASTSLDLVQAESSLREAQNNYYNKLLDLYLARLDLEQSKGNLINYINNLK
jgi:outer membrane protein TolC